MEKIFFKSLWKGLAHARKRVVNEAFHKNDYVTLVDMSTKEEMTMGRDTARNRFSHKVEIIPKGTQDADTLLYFKWTKNKET